MTSKKSRYYLRALFFNPCPMVEFLHEDGTPSSRHHTACIACTENVRDGVSAMLGTGHSIPSGLDTDALRQKAVEAAIRQEVGLN